MILQTRNLRPVVRTPTRRAASHPSNVVVPASDLTMSYDNGAQLLLTEGWWDPDSNLANSGGSGARWRTNQIGSRIQVEVSDTPIFGVLFDDIYARKTAASSLAARPFPGYWRARRSQDGAGFGAWQYAIKASTSPAGFICYHDLDPASSYLIELEPTHLMGWPNISIAAEQHRERELFPATEQGEYRQFSGFVVSEGATFATISHSETAFRTLVLGDSNSSGFLLPGSGSTTIDVDAKLGGVQTFDDRGIGVTWWRLMVDAWVAAQSSPALRLILHNVSLPAVAIAKTQLTWRLIAQASTPGYHGNLWDGYNARTRYTTTDAMQTPSVRQNPAGYTPDLVIIPLCTNDSVISAGTGFPEFDGPQFITDLVALIGAIRTTWANAKILFANTQLQDSGSVTTHADAATALGPVNLDYASDPDLHYIDLATVVSGSPVHMTSDDHVALAAAFASEFATFMAA